MKKNYLLTGTAAILTAAMVFSTMPAASYAEETTSAESMDTEASDDTEASADSSDSSSVTSLSNKESAKLSSETAEALGITKEGDNVKLTSDEKPYLAIGADLSINQRETVLNLMGISADDLENYNITVIRNSDEHEYLDNYIDSSEIGTYALSSVVIVKTEEGSGLKVATYNVDYCTVDMYKNAMTTAGITDADVIVAAPVTISGTAALVGIFKAYEDMTDTTVDSDLKNAAIEEMVATGDLTEELQGIDSGIIEGIIASLKEKLANGNLTDEDAMRTAIEEAGKEYGVTFDEDEIEQIISILKKLQGMNLDWDTIAQRATDVIEEISQYATENQSVFQKITRTVTGFFNNLLGK